jgi:hypothetical protein
MEAVSDIMVDRKRQRTVMERNNVTYLVHDLFVGRSSVGEKGIVKSIDRFSNCTYRQVFVRTSSSQIEPAHLSIHSTRL